MCRRTSRSAKLRQLSFPDYSDALRNCCYSERRRGPMELKALRPMPIKRTNPRRRWERVRRGEKNERNALDAGQVCKAQASPLYLARVRIYTEIKRKRERKIRVEEKWLKLLLLLLLPLLLLYYYYATTTTSATGLLKQRNSPSRQWIAHKQQKQRKCILNLNKF